MMLILSAPPTTADRGLRHLWRKFPAGVDWNDSLRGRLKKNTKSGYLVGLHAQRYGISTLLRNMYLDSKFIPGFLLRKLPVASLLVTHSIGTISHFFAMNAVLLTTLTKAVFNPAWLRSSKTLAVVVVLIAAFPSSTWDFTPSPAVIRSLLCSRHNVESSASSKTFFVLPSIINFPVL